MKFAITLTMIYMSLIIMTFADSLTISPFSATFHGTVDAGAIREFRNNPGNGSTTLHPGIGLLYKTESMQYGAWYFKDSFANDAGGVVLGPKYDFLEYFSVGLIGGVYVRERVPGQVNGFPISIKLDDVEIAPMAAVTGSIEIPVTDNISFETNAAMNYMVNNVQAGIKISW